MTLQRGPGGFRLGCGRGRHRQRRQLARRFADGGAGDVGSGGIGSRGSAVGQGIVGQGIVSRGVDEPGPLSEQSGRLGG